MASSNEANAPASAQSQSNPTAADVPQPGKTDPAMLEEDDEFEDFPVDDWPSEETEMSGSGAHLWEESWDDDDTSEDFSKQLKEELDKVKANR